MKQRVGDGFFVGMAFVLAAGCGGSDSGTSSAGAPSTATPAAGTASPSSGAGSSAQAGSTAVGSRATGGAGTSGATGTSTSGVATAGFIATAGSGAAAGASAAAGAAIAGTSGSAGSGASAGSSAAAGASAGKAGATAATGGASGGGNCGTESFAKIYDSIFKNTTYNCTGALCHGRDAAMATMVGNLSLSSAAVAYMQLVKVSSTSSMCSGKTRVVPGDPAGSLLVQKLRGNNTMCGAAMPVGADEITDAELKQITDWISAGACNN